MGVIYNNFGSGTRRSVSRCQHCLVAERQLYEYFQLDTYAASLETSNIISDDFPAVAAREFFYPATSDESR